MQARSWTAHVAQLSAIAVSVLICGVSCDGALSSIQRHVGSVVSQGKVAGAADKTGNLDSTGAATNAATDGASAVQNASLASVLPMGNLTDLEALVDDLEARAADLIGENDEAQREGDVHIVKAGEAPRLDPPAASSWLEDLPVEGHFDSVMSIPLDAREKRPLVVALHGDMDKPEWACSSWRAATDGYPFILCPRGTHHVDYPKMDIWTFAWLQTTRKEIDAAVKAAKERYGAHIADGPVILAGFSLGAVMAAHLMRETPSEFPYAILAEGSVTRDWSANTAKVYGEGGGKRVLFACSQKDCRNQTMAVLDWFEPGGSKSSMAYAGNLGHFFGPELAEAIRARWDWLTEGDPRWRPAADPSCKTILSSSAEP